MQERERERVRYAGQQARKQAIRPQRRKGQEHGLEQEQEEGMRSRKKAVL